MLRPKTPALGNEKMMEKSQMPNLSTENAGFERSADQFSKNQGNRSRTISIEGEKHRWI